MTVHCTVYIGKLADSSNLYLKRKCYQSILYLLLENIWSTDNTEGIEFLLLGCLSVCFHHLGKGKSSLTDDWLTYFRFLKQGSYRSDSLCSWGYPWILHLPPSTFQNLGVEGNATMTYPEKQILLTYLFIIYLSTACMPACSHACVSVDPHTWIQALGWCLVSSSSICIWFTRARSFTEPLSLL